jgi:isocitrate dehydrogenase (NAD+)
LEETRAAAKRYPQIGYEEMIIDNCAMQMVKNPWTFDVLVMPNFYGSIVQNIAAGISGGSGLMAGCCIGKNYSLFSQVTWHLAVCLWNVGFPSHRQGYPG